MKKLFDFSPVIFLACGLMFLAYWGCNVLNPSSTFCLHKIYKQPDGTYQVWWVCKTRHCELADATYEQAKAFQIKECKELSDFIIQEPTGQRTK